MTYSECSQERRWELYDLKTAIVYLFVEIGRLFTETPFKQLRGVDGGVNEAQSKLFEFILAT